MFKVGTICIGQRFTLKQNVYLNGMECEIIEVLINEEVIGAEYGETRITSGYIVKWENGEEFGVEQDNLRPKHYPGSWKDELFQEVLKELGWNPLKEKENVI